VEFVLKHARSGFQDPLLEADDQTLKEAFSHLRDRASELNCGMPADEADAIALLTIEEEQYRRRNFQIKRFIVLLDELGIAEVLKVDSPVEWVRLHRSSPNKGHAIYKGGALTQGYHPFVGDINVVIHIFYPLENRFDLNLTEAEMDDLARELAEY
jgi:hypothetical protein